MAQPSPSSELDQLFDFIIELDRLKSVLRKARPVGVERYENSAEHSWHVCVLALLLVKHCTEPVDLQRVLEILLVHDVPEIDCGDQLVFTKDIALTAIAENAAAERIFGLLPPAEGEWLLSRWREYEERATPEAKLAYAADRLMPVLHNLKGGARSWRENKVSLERVKTIVSGIAEACPDVWRHVEPLIDAVYASGIVESPASDSD